MYTINFVQFVALFSLGRIWEIYTKYIFLMSYWLEERTELALGTIRCSHPPLHPQMMEQSGSCLLPELQVFVCSWMYIPITLSAATNEDGCVLSVWHPLGAGQVLIRLDIDSMVCEIPWCTGMGGGRVPLGWMVSAWGRNCGWDWGKV